MKLVRWRLVLIPAMILALAGCSIHEGTQEWYDPTDGVGVDAGSIAVRNVVVVASDDGEATLLATLVNRGDDDQLVGVAVDGVDGSSGIGNVTVPAGGSASIGPDGNARVDVGGIDARPGGMVDVDLQFEKAPRVTVRTLVQENTGIYADALIE